MTKIYIRIYKPQFSGGELHREAGKNAAYMSVTYRLLRNSTSYFRYNRIRGKEKEKLVSVEYMII